MLRRCVSFALLVTSTVSVAITNSNGDEAPPDDPISVVQPSAERFDQKKQRWLNTKQWSVDPTDKRHRPYQQAWQELSKSLPTQSYTPQTPEQLTDVNTALASIKDSALKSCVKKAVTDSGVAQAESLDTLICFSYGISDLTGLDNFTGLTTLSLSANNISNIKPLEKLTALVDLNLGFNQISDATSLYYLRDLKYLNVNFNQISNLYPIHSLYGLVKLEFYGNKVSNLAFLEDFNNLLVLSIGGNPIADISLLTNKSKLVALDLASTLVDNISKLSGLTQLEQLFIGETGVTDISTIKSFPKLRFLSISGLAQSDISLLKGLPELKYLDASYNQLSDISTLSELTGMVDLYLGNNQITDVTPIADLTKLNSLFIANNKIKDITPLVDLGLTSIYYLDLAGNDIYCWQIRYFEDVIRFSYINYDGCDDSQRELDYDSDKLLNYRESELKTNPYDADTDQDGVIDGEDEMPNDANETVDSDGDGIGDASDPDDDNDGYEDTVDSFPLDPTEWLDTDGDGTGNNSDEDDDGDGVNDSEDELPLDPNETLDTDGDGIGNNADDDDDGDGVLDSEDDYPLDPTRSEAATLVSDLVFADNALEHCVLSLAAQNKWQEAKDVVALDCSALDIADITGIEGLTRLKTLVLWGNPIKDISALADLSELKAVDLSETQVTDLTALEGLNSLNTLKLNNTRLSSIDLLNGLSALEALALADNQITDISALSSFSQLQELTLNNNSVNNIDALSNHANITTINLSGNNDIACKDLDSMIFEYSSANIVRPAGCDGDIPKISYVDFEDEALAKCVSETAEQNGWTFADEMTSLACYNSNIRSLRGIEDLVNLETLDLRKNRIESVAPLANIKGISSLKVTKNHIQTFNGLSEFTELSVLSASNNPLVQDAIKTVGQLKSLTTLYLRGNLLSDLNALTELSALKKLYFRDNKASDISALSKLTELQVVELNNNGITTIDGLSALINATRVDLRSNGNIACDALDQLQNTLGKEVVLRPVVCGGKEPLLNELSFVDKALADCVVEQANSSGWTKRNEMTELACKGKGIRDLRGLENLTALEKLDLRQNEIGDIAPLFGLSNVTELKVSKNQILNVSPLAQMSNLTFLSIADNLIDSGALRDIVELNQLSVLYLRNNRVGDVSALTQLKKLERLYLLNNEVVDASPLAELKNLTYLQLGDNQLTNINGLAGLNKLTRLDLSGNTELACVYVEFVIKQLGESVVDSPASCQQQVSFQTDVVSDFTVIDRQRGKTYSTDKNGKRLHITDLYSGEVEKVLAFDYKPGRMFQSADGKLLYVVLLKWDYSQYRSGSDQAGYIGVINLDKQSLVRAIEVNIDPLSVVVTSGGKMIVSSGSGSYWSKVIAVDANSGSSLGSLNGYAMTLALHPDEQSVFGFPISYNSNTIYKYDISGVGIDFAAENSQTNSNKSVGDSWFSAQGDYLLTAGGVLYNSDDMSVIATLPLGYDRIRDAIFDLEQQLLFVVTDKGVVKYFNLNSLILVGTIEGISDARHLSIVDGAIVVVSSRETSGTTTTLVSHPCPACGSNTAPVADFSFTPENGDTTQTYEFDASASTDAEKSKLLYRWDFDNDGQWDIDFSDKATQSKSYTTPGTKLVAMQVKDAGGLVDTIVKSFNVKAKDGSEDPIFELPFKITDVQFDKVRGKSYVSDLNGKKVYVLDNGTGFVEHTYSFDYLPEHMTMSPDGKQLYVALLKSPRGYYQGEDGFVAIIDLEKQQLSKSIKVDVDPYDLVVTSGGKLIVTSGSSQWKTIHAYDVKTSVEVGKADIRPRSALALHPDEQWLFSVTSDSYPNDLHQFDLSGSGIAYLDDSPYNGEYRIGTNIWITPDGQHMISGGDIFKTEDMSYVGPLTNSNVWVKDLVFDTDQNLIFVLTTNREIHYFTLDTFEMLDIIPNVGNTQYVGVDDKKVYMYMRNSYAKDTFKSIDHPCTACATNTSPVADFSFTPSDGNTGDTYVFDASNSTDAEDGSDLNFRWDLNGDGQWDDEYSKESSISTQYIIAGSRKISLQVKDSLGFTSVLQQQIDVTQGETLASDISEDSLKQTWMNINGVVTDSVNKIVYSLDRQSRRLYLTELADKQISKYFQFEQVPQRMVRSPDGKKLYVALLTKDFNSYNDDDELGIILTLDLAKQAIVNSYYVDVDPFDLIVSSDGKLVISSGSGRTGMLHTYNSQDGTALSTVTSTIRSARLTLHPTEQVVYAVIESSWGSTIEKFDISGDEIVLLATQPSSNNKSVGGYLWVTPDGKYLISKAGDIYDAEDMSYHGRLLENSQNIGNLVFDAEQSLIFVYSNYGQIDYYNLSGFSKVGSLAISNNYSYVYFDIVDDKLYLFNSSGYANSKVTEFSHPCTTCGSNTAPVAAFTFTPTLGDTGDTYEFDGSTSTDDSDSDSLMYRWDLNGDDQWDDEYSDSATISTKFVLAGTHTVRLQVKDTLGFSHIAEQSFEVSQGTDYGIDAADTTANDLPFNINDVAIVEARGKAYISDKQGKRLYLVDLASGLVDKYFEFDLMPERMTLSSDGSKLYLALLTREHSSYWWEEDQYGFIATFDTELEALVKTYRIETDPYGLVVNDENKLIVSSGSGQWTDIFSYDAETGEKLGSGHLRQMSQLTLHPNQKWVYAADSDLSPADFEKFDISGNSVSSLGDTPYHGNYSIGAKVYATPDGNYVIARSGHIFNADDMTHYDELESGYTGNIAFDESHNLLFTVGNDSVQYHDLTSFDKLGSIADITDAVKVYVVNGKVYIIKYISSGNYELIKKDHPCTSCSASKVDHSAALLPFSPKRTAPLAPMVLTKRAA